MSIKAFSCLFVCFNDIKHAIFTCTVDNRFLDINHHIAIHNAAVIAAAIDVATLETTIHIIASSSKWYGGRWSVILLIVNKGVPLQSQSLIGFIFPTFRLNLQAIKIEFQLIS